jgi:hypothetical protein
LNKNVHTLAATKGWSTCRILLANAWLGKISTLTPIGKIIFGEFNSIKTKNNVAMSAFTAIKELINQFFLAETTKCGKRLWHEVNGSALTISV